MLSRQNASLFRLMLGVVSVTTTLITTIEFNGKEVSRTVRASTMAGPGIDPGDGVSVGHGMAEPEREEPEPYTETVIDLTYDTSSDESGSEIGCHV